MEAQRQREALCEIGRRMYARNLVAATDGNLTIRLAEGRFLCTPSGVSKGYMHPDMLLIVNGHGECVAGQGKVTSEIFTHLAVYEERPDAGAVLHAHPPYATALMLAGHGLEAPLLPEVVMGLGAVPTTEYATPGTREGGEVVRAGVRDHDAVLLDRHGAITLGKDIYDAYYKLEKVEHAAQTLHAALSLGEPRRLDPDQVARIRESRRAYLAPQ